MKPTIENEETDWWWVDYLEGELEPHIDQQLLKLLRHSEEDRQTFESFRLVKEWVRESDVAHTYNWTPQKLKNFKDKVMTQVLASGISESRQTP